MKTGSEHIRVEMKRFFLIMACICAASGCNSDTKPIPIGDCNEDALGVSRVIEVDGNIPIHNLLTHKEVVLTFDDGPHSKETKRVLSELSKECVSAAFFLMGKNAKKHPELVRLIHDHGHALGGHSWSHTSLVKLDIADAKNQILKGNAAIEAAIQNDRGLEDFRVRLFRFPNLHMNDELSEYLAAQKLVPVWVHADGSDWSRQPADKVVEEIFLKLERSDEKGVILLHPPAGQADEATRLLLQHLKSEGYRVVAITPPR